MSDIEDNLVPVGVGNEGSRKRETKERKINFSVGRIKMFRQRRLLENNRKGLILKRSIKKDLFHK